MTPGINGSFTGKDLVDNKNTAINFGFIKQDSHHARRIILQSKVDWKDTKDDINLNGDFRVILLAEANESNNLNERGLTGSVYIYPLQNEPPLENGKIDLPWFDPLHTANKCLIDYKSQPVNWNCTQTELNKNYDKLKTILNNYNQNPIEKHFYSVCFRVHHNGLMELKLSYPNQKDIDESDSYLIMRQAFYYTKYSLHLHKHHFAEEDSLTTIIQKETNSAAKPETGLRLLAQLKRELTSIKRTYANGGNRTYCDEQGMIAYMHSFCVSLKDYGYLTSELYDRETEYLKSVKDSFLVQSNKKDKREQNTSEIQSTYRTYLALFLSVISLLWLSTFKVYLNYEEVAHILDRPPTFLEHLTTISGIFIAAIFVYRKQVAYKIENTLETKGFVSWIEKHYTVKENEFKKKNRRKKFKSLATILITLFIVLTIMEIARQNGCGILYC